MSGTVPVVVTAVASATVVVVPAVALWWLDRRPRGVEWVLLAVTLAWSGAAGAALGSRSLTLPAPLEPVATAALVAALPLALKAAGRDGFDCPADAVVLFSVAAGGWALGWLAAARATFHDDPAAALAEAAFSGLAWIAIWALVGAVVGLASLLASRWARVAMVPVAAVVVVTGHFAWMALRRQLPSPSGSGLAATLGVAVAMLVLAAALVLWWEGRRLAGELREEVQLGVLPPWAEEVFPVYWRRVRGGWWPQRGERAVVSRLVSRLALRKQALRRRGVEVGDLTWLEVVQLRNRLCRMIVPLRDDDVG